MRELERRTPSALDALEQEREALHVFTALLQQGNGADTERIMNLWAVANNAALVAYSCYERGKPGARRFRNGLTVLEELSLAELAWLAEQIQEESDLEEEETE